MADPRSPPSPKPRPRGDLRVGSPLQARAWATTSSRRTTSRTDHTSRTASRGRDDYTAYRAIVPRDVDQLLVAGRNYSAEPDAQKVSREIPPCVVMGQAAGVAAATALDQGVRVRDADVPRVRVRVRAHGADPGDGLGEGDRRRAVARGAPAEAVESAP